MSNEKLPFADCPMVASLDVSIQFAEEHPEYYSNPDQQLATIGSLKQAKELLVGIVGVLGCNGPRIAEGAYQVCPHAKTAESARFQVNGPSLQAKAEFRYAALLGKPEEKPDRRDGQYL